MYDRLSGAGAKPVLEKAYQNVHLALQTKLNSSFKGVFQVLGLDYVGEITTSLRNQGLRKV